MGDECGKCGGPRVRSAPYAGHPRGKLVCRPCDTKYLREWTTKHPGYFAAKVKAWEAKQREATDG